ncbi:MAG: hypothetical protein IPG71_03275 [bacterium]|nr:hypothetical protein [bacterium]
MFKEIADVFDLLQREGFITSWALGRGVATIFHSEPFYTEDVDVFVELTGESALVNMRPIYDRLSQMGIVAQGQYVIIAGSSVQIIIPPDALEAEAMREAVEMETGSGIARFFRPEHLACIYLRLGRPKDKTRLVLLLKDKKFSHDRFLDISKRFDLEQKWLEYQKLSS